eukprot:9759581-Prorocentrum_lima.AAC.1
MCIRDRTCADQFRKTPDYYWNRWDGLDGFGERMTGWSDFVHKVEKEDMPAGLLELEALAQALHLRIAVCCDAKV